MSKNINVYPSEIQLDLVGVLRDMTGISKSQLYIIAMKEYINRNSDKISIWMKENKKAQ
jgi:hypothetical protein